MPPPLEVGSSSYSVPSNDRLVSYYSQGLRKKYLMDADKTQFGHVHLQANAEIRYQPNFMQYLARTGARIQAGNLEQDVPTGWPKQLDGPLVWTSSDLPDETQYVHVLAESEKSELKNALKHFKGLGLEDHQVNRDNFPLPTLASKLEQMSKSIYQGRGFSIVRGFDVDAYSKEDATLVFVGVSSYIGDKHGKQNPAGDAILHVVRQDDDPEDNSQPFHNDTVADVLGLLTQSCAPEGGQTTLASVWTIYNELAATRPDLIHTLSQGDWPHDTFGREPKFHQRALLHYYDEKMILACSRRLLVGKPTDPRSEDIPGLTEAQAEALDAIHYIGKKHEIKLSMEKGDMRFINNMGIVHSRERFSKTASPDDDRHLVRIWINNEKLNWKLPRVLRLAWERVFEDEEERPAVWNFAPFTKRDAKIRIAVSCD